MAAKKSHPVLLRAKADVFAFIDGQREGFKLSRLCALLWGDPRGLLRVEARARERARGSRTGATRGPSGRIFEASGGTYGSPRVQRSLEAQGYR